MVVIKEDNKEIIISGRKIPLQLNFSLGALILQKISEHGDHISQIYTKTDEKCTFAQVKTRSIQVAEELKRRGIGHGDVISICSTNTPSSILPLLGGLYVGAAINPLDPSLSKMDTKHLMNITTPKIIFCEPECLQMIEEVLEESQLSTEIVVFGKSDKYTNFSQFLEQSVNEAEFKPVNFTDAHEHIAFLMSSSGTTGLPKVVSITHANLLAQFQLSQDVTSKLPHTVTLLNMSSLFWISGIMVTLGSIFAGVIRILTPPFDPEHVLQTIEKYKSFWIVVGVTFFSRIVTHPSIENYDLSAVRILTVSGGKASKFHIQEGQKHFKNCRITSSYGMTEMAGVAFKLDNAKPNSIGYLLPNLEAKIIDPETGKTLGPNVSGELCVRGPIVFKGYYRNPKSTAETIDSEGWIHTGDRVFYDEEHCFFIEGRIKEQFKCRGWQISPVEMESILVEHPAIKEAAVIGVPHPVDVARPRAFIVKRQNSQITEQDVHSYMLQRMSQNKQITGGIVFMDTLPTTPTGKIQKRTLVELARQQPISASE